MKKYFLLLLSFATVLSSCLQDESIAPRSEVIKVNVNSALENSKAYQNFNSVKPSKGWTDEAFNDALKTLRYQFEMEVLNNLPNSEVVLEFENNKENLYPKDFHLKRGPCSDQYVNTVENAGIAAVACIATAGYDGGWGCTTAYVAALVSADRDYDKCIRETYPNSTNP